jgi:dihydroorotate dehydrogenase (NAD+) catalytic subunit
LSDIKVKLFKETLTTPLIPASGVFGYGDEYDFIQRGSIGAFVTKGLSLEPKEGNPTPRIAETACGIMNSVGLQNIGIKSFVNEKLPEIKKLKMKIIVNFFGNTDEEYVGVAELLDRQKDIFALEMNVSCPNVKTGGIAFGQDPDLIERLTKAVRKVTKKPLIVKLTPNVTSIPEIASAAEDGGADAISLINTVTALKIDINTRKSALGAGTGGLSGRAIKPIAVRAVYEAAKTVKIPIIGMGGIYTAEDALEFIMAGATALQVGSAIFYEPDICSIICKDLKDFMHKNNIKNLDEIRGCAL